MLPDVQPLPGGLVVVFEGIDGAGKTTQLALAQAALMEAGWPVLSTRNLGGTPIGEALRAVLKSTLPRPPLTDLYVSLAIQEPLLEVIATARAAGKVILLDRGPLSLAAYQIYGTGIDEAIGWPHVQASMDRLRPELTLLYDADIKIALQRARAQSTTADYFESKPLSYFERVAHGYQLAGKRYPLDLIRSGHTIAEAHEQTMRFISHAITLKHQS